MVQEVSTIEIEEIGVGELSKLIFHIEIFLLLGGQFVGGRKCIETGEVLRDVGCLAAFVAVHDCDGVLGRGCSAPQCCLGETRRGF